MRPLPLAAFRNSIIAALNQGNHYAAVTLAIMAPDVLAALHDPGPGKSRKRFKNWWSLYAEPVFVEPDGKGTRCILTAEAAYQLRCSLFHAGSEHLDGEAEHARIAFFVSDGGPVPLIEDQIGRVIYFEVGSFVRAVLAAMENWLAAVEGGPQVVEQLDRLLVIRTEAEMFEEFQASIKRHQGA